MTRICDICGIDKGNFSEFALYHHTKPRYFCSKKCLFEFVDKYKKQTLSGKILLSCVTEKFGSVETIPTKDIKNSIKEILFHKKCLNCKLNICSCGRQDWVVDVNVIKEEVGEELLK